MLLSTKSILLCNHRLVPCLSSSLLIRFSYVTNVTRTFKCGSEESKMALQQISLSSAPSMLRSSSSSATAASLHLDRFRRATTIGDYRCLKNQKSGSSREGACVVKCSLETAGPVVVTVGQVTEVDKDTFWPIVNASGDKPVVLDMYTQWCGPCKVMAPKFQELAEKHLDVVFLKLDCNKENKVLAKELGLRVVPTFKILKDGKVVKEVTGAKLDDLIVSIETVKSS